MCSCFAYGGCSGLLAKFCELVSESNYLVGPVVWDMCMVLIGAEMPRQEERYQEVFRWYLC